MNTTETKISPMMAQWHECKEAAQDAILFFRLGDFYEAFYEDAVICSRELELTLTKRQLVPMSGVPSHTIDSYIDKLVGRGYQVAIAEQVENPKETKGLVKREVTRIVTPGTLTHLADKSNNYFAAMTQVGQRIGLAFLDISCADCRVIEVENQIEALNELYRFRPSELLTSQKMVDKYPTLFQELKLGSTCRVDLIEEWRFEHQLNLGFLTQLLKVHSLDGFGLKGMMAAINAAGALLTYVQDTLYQPLGPIQAILPYNQNTFMLLDKTTLRNLELVEAQNGLRKNSLLGLLDHTQTPMGARLLKRWVLQPLLQVASIYERQEAIEQFLRQLSIVDTLTSHLSQVRDLERLMTRISSGQASPRDYVALKSSLEPIGAINALLLPLTAALIKKSPLRELSELVEIISLAFVDEPPLRISDGHIFRDGYHTELDILRKLQSDSKTWMQNYQETLRQTTGIKTLKVGYTRVSGFYIEVSRGQADNVPDLFQRRQTLTNAERFMTPELKAFEEKILTAEEKIADLELALFQEIRQKVSLFSQEVLTNAQSIATLDCLLSLALVSHQHRYVKPEIDNSFDLEILEGRHPVIESSLISEKFIPNDTHLDKDQRLMLITGPNMAGKSTYIRQVALIAILAQIGCFVPASSARLGIIDKIFTRIGASDDLSRGQSTFMVEMTETAHILHNATANSLVILDEIGRGTSTYDGISLAWSIAEFLLTTPGKTAKTLFATHYWELTKLEEKVPGAINYNVAVHESDDRILFLRKIVKGGTDKSYGIHVAQLAGLPSPVLTRAKEILQHLEENANQKSAFEISRPRKLAKPKEPSPNEVQLSLWKE